MKLLPRYLFSAPLLLRRVALVLLLVASGVASGAVSAAPPYPLYDQMPRPEPSSWPPAPGWHPSVLPGPPRYDHETLAPACHIPAGVYRYVLQVQQDYQADEVISKAVLKIHINEGGLAIATLEMHPDRSAVSWKRLFGDEPRRELYVINSYRTIADLQRCSGYSLRIDANHVQLHDKFLDGALNARYEPEHSCLRVSGGLVRRRPATGLLGESEFRVQLDSVCFPLRR